ncbi:MAG: RES family NAD+ phosphorylase [Thermoleophilaceae bacterium]
MRSGSLVARVYARGGRYPSRWNDFRYAGPIGSARFDHHVPGEQRGVLYGAASMATCVAEVFQGTRVIDRVADDRCLTAFRTTRAVRLLDLTGDWPTRAGASQAIASGPRNRAQAWARAIYEAYPALEGLWYPSSMHGGHPAVVLSERAADALPADPELDVPLTHPGSLPDLTRAANALGCLIR